MTILDWAIEYHRRDWSIIPVGRNKRFASKAWKQFQEKRPDPGQLKKWFANGKLYPAVILGQISGGLVCRDFDQMDAYDSWAKEYPDLAQTLPTVRTSRGKHVYCASNWHGFLDLGDGELRGSTGHYCVLPPAVHETGTNYTWENKLPDGDLPILDPFSIGLGPIQQEQGNVTEDRGLQKDYGRVVFEGAISQEVENAIIEAMKQTIPERIGQRNHNIFSFARRLKGVPELKKLPPITFESYVRLWHQWALPYIRTKLFEETWIDFLKGWPRVKWPANAKFMTEILERAKANPLEGYKIAGIGVLGAVCRELQQAHGDSPFYLSARTGADMLGVSPMSISRWLFLLEQDRWIGTVQKGGTKENPRKATRFKYVGGHYRN